MDGERSYTVHNKGASMEGPGPSRQNGSHPPPLGKMATGYNLTRSFMDNQLEQYRQKLPRRRRKRCHGCLSLSGYSWTFLVLALIQAITVMGLQIAIAVLGQFRQERVDAYVECLEQFLQTSIPPNTTFPSFGRDKEIYIYLFIAMVVYNFALCIYALRFQNIVEVFTFMIINTLAMAYACVQVYQFRGFGDRCPSITVVGWLAMANALVLLVFTLLFLGLSVFIYVEFGWKTYVLVDCNPAMRYYYRVYEILMSGVKLLILFIIIFSVGQCILILQGNYELYLTILIALAAVIAYPVVYFIVRQETHIGNALVLCVGLLWVAYSIFKIVRYATRSCPLCIEQVNEAEASMGMIREQINALTMGSGSGSGNGTASRRDLSFLNREEEFGHLIMVGVMNLVTAIIVICIFIHYWRQLGKGLKAHFIAQNDPFRKLYKHLRRKDGDDDSMDHPDMKEHTGKALTIWVSGKKKDKKKMERSDSPSEGESFSPLHTSTLPTNQGSPRRERYLSPIKEEKISETV